PELPPPVHMRLHEGRAPAVDERDHGDALGDGVAVRLVEALEPPPVAPLLPRRLDQLVEDRIGEAALVRPARRLEEEAEVVLRIRIARQPACDPDRRGLDPLADLHRLLLAPRPGRDRDPVAEDLAPAAGDRVEYLVPDR